MMANPSNSWWRIMSSSSPIPQQEEEEEEANNSSDLFSSSHHHHHHPQLVLGDLGVGSSSSNYSFSDNNPQELPNSWSQLLLGGLTGEEDKFVGVVGHFQPFKKLENWEDQILNPLPTRGHDHDHHHDDHAKQEQEASQNRSDDQDLHHFHSNITMPVSSPRSCVTTSFSSNNYTNNSKNNSILDFSNNKAQDHSYECNSTATGGVCKKARVSPSSSSQPPLKVRKEKLGDRLTALHQLVSPFGKTDTASVLLEAIGYIRFLQCQIQTLSNPYLGNSSGNMRTQDFVNGGEGRNGEFEAEMQMGSEEKVKDLRSKGLCLVPVSCTQQVGSDNGADYWAPAFGSGGGF